MGISIISFRKNRLDLQPTCPSEQIEYTFFFNASGTSEQIEFVSQRSTVSKILSSQTSSINLINGPILFFKGMQLKS